MLAAFSQASPYREDYEFLDVQSPMQYLLRPFAGSCIMASFTFL
jgi:hypothetical protein